MPCTDAPARAQVSHDGVVGLDTAPVASPAALLALLRSAAPPSGLVRAPSGPDALIVTRPERARLLASGLAGCALRLCMRRQRTQGQPPERACAAGAGGGGRGGRGRRRRRRDRGGGAP
jgi:hypothetical protein